MLSLPSLAPQDSHVLWYTSSTANHLPPPIVDFSSDNVTNTPNNLGPNAQNQRRHLPTYRTPLARLRHDEENLKIRKANISNYGMSWIKPPGIPKSLYQLREEKRELEEHLEALRREALAQELADAEARELEELAAAQEDNQGMGAEGEEQRNLDDDIPDGDADTTGFGPDDDDDDDDDDDEEEGEDEEVENDLHPGPRNVTAARLPEDIYREALVRGAEVRAMAFAEEDSDIDETDQAQILHEEDLLPSQNARGSEDMDMDMGVDLDADIPDAEEEAEEYEHTDTEDELTSSSEEDEDEDRGGRTHQGGYAAASSMVRSDGTQNSMDLSSVLASGSSQIGSSPRRMGEMRARRMP